MLIDPHLFKPCCRNKQRQQQQQKQQQQEEEEDEEDEEDEEEEVEVEEGRVGVEKPQLEEEAKETPTGEENAELCVTVTTPPVGSGEGGWWSPPSPSPPSGSVSEEISGRVFYFSFYLEWFYCDFFLSSS